MGGIALTGASFCPAIAVSPFAHAIHAAAVSTPEAHAAQEMIEKRSLWQAIEVSFSYWFIWLKISGLLLLVKYEY
jgi:hypothetical protein